MFYSQIILAKKGPLGQLWMAAHFQDKKLSRQQIFATDISASVDSIVKPAVPLALRVSGHLLLGVVRIYSKKVHFLWQDCHNANLQIQLAFVQQQQPSSGIDMDDNNNKASRRKRRSRNSRHQDDEELVTTIPATTAMEGFGIPFDLNDDSMNNADDWVPAELDKEHDLDPDEEGSVQAALGLSASVGSPHEQRRKLARAAADQTLHSMDETATAGTEEQWTAFNPDDEEEEEEGEKQGDKETASKQADEDGDAPMLPPDDDEEPPMMPPDDEEPPMMPPDDDDEQARQPDADQSSLQVEIPRGGGSVATADTGEAGRPSALLDQGSSVGDRARMSEAEFSVPNDVSGIPILDEDEGPGGRASSPNLADHSSVASTKPQDESSTAAVSLGGTPEEGSKKRKSTAKNRRRKRRKIRNNEGSIELSGSHIRAMLADTSDTIVEPPVIGEEEEEEPIPKDLRGLISTRVDEGLMRFLSYEQLFRRPALADDGNAAPELIELWARIARLRDEALANAEREARAQQQEEEEGDASSLEETEVPRQQEKQDDESTEAPPPMPDDEEPPMMPPDEDEEMPPPGDDEEPPMMPPDDDEDLPPVAADDEEEEMSPAKRASSLSLGLAKTLDEDMNWDEEEEEEQRQAANSDELVSSNSKWHKHTIKVYTLLKSRLAPPGASEEEVGDKEPHLGYNALSEGCSRRTAVGLFLEVLQLKTWDYIECHQDDSFGDIIVSPGPKFSEPVPTN